MCKPYNKPDSGVYRFAPSANAPASCLTRICAKSNWLCYHNIDRVIDLEMGLHVVPLGKPLLVFEANKYGILSVILHHSFFRIQALRFRGK